MEYTNCRRVGYQIATLVCLWFQCSTRDCPRIQNIIICTKTSLRDNRSSRLQMPASARVDNSGSSALSLEDHNPHIFHLPHFLSNFSPNTDNANLPIQTLPTPLIPYPHRRLLPARSRTQPVPLLRPPFPHHHGCGLILPDSGHSNQVREA